MAATLRGFAARVVQWQQLHGRNDLPWQNTRDPYRVWLSEVMLQQTQVTTVLGYYARFLERFPSVQSLAAVHLDEVLGLWSGLGYYSRARNLHRCAQTVVEEHGGKFPENSGVLAGLPGIGRSTAAAIASLCFSERVAILDANVKRVVTRVLAFEGDLASHAQERLLWEAATALLPPPAKAHESMPRYTQGMMDLGATVCLPARPRCDSCPVASMCQARVLGRALEFPRKTRKIKRSAKSLWLLWAYRDDGSVWLATRPTPGVWAGLYCLPLFDDEDGLMAALPARLRPALEFLPVFTHVLTHKDLHLHVARIRVTRLSFQLPDGGWKSAAQWPALGLPAPLRKLLDAVELPVAHQRRPPA